MYVIFFILFFPQERMRKRAQILAGNSTATMVTPMTMTVMLTVVLSNTYRL